MKFTENVSAKVNPEWAHHFFSYDDLKGMLHDGLRKAPKIMTSSEVNDGKFNNAQYVAVFGDKFFKLCDQELEKINKFCREKVHESVTKFLDLKVDAEALLAYNREERRRKISGGFWRQKKIKITEATLETSFKAFYVELMLLQNYQEVNYNGFKKILAKHDAQFSSTSGDHMMKTKVDVSYFHRVKDVQKLIQETEFMVATVLDGGSKAKAVKRLAVAVKDNSVGPWTGFKLGLMTGTFLVLIAVLAVSGITDRNKPVWRLVIRFYRGPVTLIIYLLLIGINIYAWTSRGINHVYIFDLNPADHMVHHQFWNIAAGMGMLLAISIVIFVSSENIGLPVFTSPFILLVIQIAFLCNPFPLGYFNARRWLFKIIIRMFTAPFHRVTFADFWMCDQLSSLISLLLDYIFTICYFTNPDTFMTKKFNDPTIACLLRNIKSGCKYKCDSPNSYWRQVIRCIPPFLRFVQCLRRFRDNHLVCPHLVNGLKYFLSLTATILSGLQAHGVKVVLFGSQNGMLIIWVAVHIISSLMSYSWDIKMDWGLSNVRSKHRFLRAVMLYPQTWYYYCAIVGDLFLRFTWAASLSLTEMGFLQADIMLTLTAPVEIFRRFVWNLFRLENEQINNNNALLAAQRNSQVSISSFELTDEQQMQDLLRIMDQPDGAARKRAGLLSRTDASFTSFDFYNSKCELFTRTGSKFDLELDADDDLSELSSVIMIGDTQPSLLQRLREMCCNCYGFGK